MFHYRLAQEMGYMATMAQNFGSTPHFMSLQVPHHFEVVYGSQPPRIVQVVQRELMDRDEPLRQLKKHLLMAQDRMRVQANKHHTKRRLRLMTWFSLSSNRTINIP